MPVACSSSSSSSSSQRPSSPRTQTYSLSLPLYVKSVCPSRSPPREARKEASVHIDTTHTKGRVLKYCAATTDVFGRGVYIEMPGKEGMWVRDTSGILLQLAVLERRCQCWGHAHVLCTVCTCTCTYTMSVWEREGLDGSRPLLSLHSHQKGRENKSAGSGVRDR